MPIFNEKRGDSVEFFGDSVETSKFKNMISKLGNWSKVTGEVLSRCVELYLCRWIRYSEKVFRLKTKTTSLHQKINFLPCHIMISKNDKNRPCSWKAQNLFKIVSLYWLWIVWWVRKPHFTGERRDSLNKETSFSIVRDHSLWPYSCSDPKFR